MPDGIFGPGSPTLFGRRMRTRTRVAGVTVWESRYGGLSLSIAHDPENRRPYYWQVDAWTKRGVLSGNASKREMAVKALERAVRGVVRDLPEGALR